MCVYYSSRVPRASTDEKRRTDKIARRGPKSSKDTMKCPHGLFDHGVLGINLSAENNGFKNVLNIASFPSHTL